MLCVVLTCKVNVPVKLNPVPFSGFELPPPIVRLIAPARPLLVSTRPPLAPSDNSVVPPKVAVKVVVAAIARPLALMVR